MNTIDSSNVHSKSSNFCPITSHTNKWHFEPKSKIARSLAFGQETWKREEKDVITTSSGQEYRNLQIRSEFDNLVQMWKKATSHYSFLGQIITHPAYLRIIGMGEKALPLILDELRQRPNGNWFSALEAITGKDIGQEANSIDEAIQLWLEWGEQNKYLRIA